MFEERLEAAELASGLTPSRCGLVVLVVVGLVVLMVGLVVATTWRVVVCVFGWLCVVC